MNEAFSIRLAREDDIPTLEVLIPLSVRVLQAPFYSPAQMEAALGPIFGVDRQLISDGTYFIVEHSGYVVGCGGWSRRRAVFGSDRARAGEDALLDPARDLARIRAFFVHPDWARRGIGRSILAASESAICAAGFHDAVLVATLAGEPLYASFGYTAAERYEVPLSDGLTLPVVRMVKSFNANRANGPFQASPGLKLPPPLPCTFSILAVHSSSFSPFLPPAAGRRRRAPRRLRTAKGVSSPFPS